MQSPFHTHQEAHHIKFGECEGGNKISGMNNLSSTIIPSRRIPNNVFYTCPHNTNYFLFCAQKEVFVQ